MSEDWLVVESWGQETLTRPLLNRPRQGVRDVAGFNKRLA